MVDERVLPKENSRDDRKGDQEDTTEHQKHFGDSASWRSHDFVPFPKFDGSTLPETHQAGRARPRFLRKPERLLEHPIALQRILDPLAATEFAPA